MTPNPAHLSPRLLTVPNLLTLVRLGLIPLVLFSLWRGEAGRALALFVAAGVTDGLDGLLARLLNQRSTAGMYLDPVADKLLLSSTFLVLSLTGEIPWLVTGFVFGRDLVLMIGVGVLVLRTGERRFPPSFLGKTSTVVQICTVLAVMLDEVWAREWLSQARQIGFMMTILFVVGSGAHYVYRGARLLRLRRHSIS